MTTHVVEGRLLKGNRVSLLRLLEQNNAVELQKLLIENPDYMEMRCSDEYSVSF